MSDQSTNRSRMLRTLMLGLLTTGALTGPAAQAWQVNVERGDTLMIIAERTREADTTTVEQQALAILDLNPGAFAKDNVNGLRWGTSLEIPDQVQAEVVGADEARRMIRQQHADWNAGLVVGAGEQLMVIAAETRESDAITVDQQALALLELNPRAFAKGNVNGLLRGSKLKLPSLAQARSVSAENAARIIDQQHRDWALGAAGEQNLQLAQTREVTIIRGSQIEVTDLRY